MMDTLTPREHDVHPLLLKGMKGKDIAFALGISCLGAGFFTKRLRAHSKPELIIR